MCKTCTVRAKLNSISGLSGSDKESSFPIKNLIRHRDGGSTESKEVSKIEPIRLRILIFSQGK